MDIGIVGGSGYAGAELLRLLADHPVLKVRAVAADRAAGRDLAEVFPHLGQSGELISADPAAFAGCALVFLATPAQASTALTPALRELDVAVVDLSDAARLEAVYGLPELHRAALPGAGLVANPGCYPTAALLALAVLAGHVDPVTVHVAGLSGWSGAGRGLRDDLHASHAGANVAPYSVGAHRHTHEIDAQWALLCGQAAPVAFTPHLVPMARGLLATVSARLLPGHEDVEELRGAARERYAEEPFVRVLAAGTWPQTAHVAGSNVALLQLDVHPGGTVTATCAIDNLVKGAAGQAIQNANLILGLPETAGLPTAGLYP